MYQNCIIFTLTFPCRFKQLPRNYWKDKSNQVSKLKEIEQKLGINEPTDWYRFTVRNARSSGGTTLLEQYNNSLSSMLSALYPSVQWDLTRYVSIQLFSLFIL